MQIRQVTARKERYMELLLLGDEQEDMILRYLDRGTMYVLEDPDLVAVCLVTDEGDGVLEIKNIAVSPQAQRKGYGRAMIDFLQTRYRGQYRILQAGTGDSPLTIPFYESCGFCRSHVVPDFFTNHYDHPIYEAGVLLRDMVYLQKPL
ncbi:GNAT family N-acetyltransferase [Ruminococcus sp.]|uniref:GNAT family N-acetyltransferase n=1 Tax=Ruminococcus sp. TaxID=41978 RepID=UPI003F08EF2B